MSEDIRYRQNRYLLMMGVRLVCFIAALLMFLREVFLAIDSLKIGHHR